MSKAPSPYSIETLQGTLELSKGAYLTMIKRKNSTIKTLCKSKPISHSNNFKPTLKKSKKMNASHQLEPMNLRRSVERSYSRELPNKETKNMVKSLRAGSCIKNSVQLWNQKHKNVQNFQVWDDRELYNIKGIPII